MGRGARFNADDLPDSIRRALESTPGAVVGSITFGPTAGGTCPVMPRPAAGAYADTPPASKAVLSQPEREMQVAAESWLRQQGIEALHLSHRAREKKGWPDLTFAVYHHPVAVEIKSAGGVLSEDQRRVLRRLASPVNGWAVYVWRLGGAESEFPVLRTWEEFCGMVRAWYPEDPGLTFAEATAKGSR